MPGVPPPPLRAQGHLPRFNNLSKLAFNPNWPEMQGSRKRNEKEAKQRWKFNPAINGTALLYEDGAQVSAIIRNSPLAETDVRII